MFGKKKNEPDYFAQLSAMARYTQQAAELLDDMMHQYTDVHEKAERIHDVEHAGDGALHAMLNQLASAFITPIDREDLVRIGNGVDNITDAIEDVSNLFDMLCIEHVRPEAMEISKLIVSCSKALCAAMDEFEHFKRSTKLQELLIDVNRREEEGDRVHRAAIKTLFQSDEMSVLEVVRWKDIYDTMEQVLDACEDVADMLEGLIAKNK